MRRGAGEAAPRAAPARAPPPAVPSAPVRPSVRPVTTLPDPESRTMKWSLPRSTSVRRRSDARRRTRPLVEPLEERLALSATPVGPQVHVNTFSGEQQAMPVVAMDQAGDHVVVWQSNGQNVGVFDIFAQRYDAAGVPQGAEFKVSEAPVFARIVPAVAMDQAGNFVVAWESRDQDSTDPNVPARGGIYARRFSAAGAALGGEFRVNTTVFSEQEIPSIAMDPAGDFVVTWESVFQDGSGYGIFAQRYNAAGATQGGEFQVNTTTQGDQLNPTAAMDAAGDFVIAWQTTPDTPAAVASHFDILAQTYGASGVASGGEFQVNAANPNPQVHPAVALNASGSLVVAWEGFLQTPPQDDEIYAQRYQVDVQPACDKNDVTNISFQTNGQATVTDLRGHTHQGDHVVVTFTVLPGHYDQLSLVSYTAPGPTFDAKTADQQVVFQTDIGTFGPGVHTLSVDLPDCYYQVDFVCGPVIVHLGPAGTNNFYTPQNRLFSADNGGCNPSTVTPDVSCGQAAGAAFWGCSKGQALILAFNGAATSTALPTWLATTFPNLYGPGTTTNPNPYDLTGKTNADVAALAAALAKARDLASVTEAQVLATALSVYATTFRLGGTAGVKYGFAVNGLGLGASGVNVGAYGSVFGLANNAKPTVLQLLQAVNARSKNGVLMSGNTTSLTVTAWFFWSVGAAGGVTG